MSTLRFIAEAASSQVKKVANGTAGWVTAMLPETITSVSVIDFCHHLSSSSIFIVCCNRLLSSFIAIVCCHRLSSFVFLGCHRRLSPLSVAIYCHRLSSFFVIVYRRRLLFSYIAMAFSLSPSSIVVYCHRWSPSLITVVYHHRLLSSSVAIICRHRPSLSFIAIIYRRRAGHPSLSRKKRSPSFLSSFIVYCHFVKAPDFRSYQQQCPSSLWLSSFCHHFVIVFYGFAILCHRSVNYQHHLPSLLAIIVVYRDRLYQPSECFTINNAHLQRYCYDLHRLSLLSSASSSSSFIATLCISRVGHFTNNNPHLHRNYHGASSPSFNATICISRMVVLPTISTIFSVIIMTVIVIMITIGIVTIIIFYHDYRRLWWLYVTTG